jgi:hypothetical protein
MKFLSTQFFGLLALLLMSLSISAQDLPSVIINDQQVEEGQIIDIDVVVTDYSDIVSTSFKLDWDSSVLRYVGLENIALNMSEDDGFNTMDANEGRIVYLYIDFSLEGNSLDNEFPLFTIQMEVVGEEGGQTTFLFTDTEVVDTSATALNATFTGGTITVGEPNSTFEVSKLPLSAEISPNPFSANANVILELNDRGEVLWTLSEINGQLIKQGEAEFTPGTHILELENTLFKHTGTYLLKLQMGDHVITRRLLYVVP